MADDKVTYFASTDYRNKHIPFGIKQSDREKHLYVVGKTGMGKSTFLENLAIQDIEHGNGIGFVDPHGMSAKKLLEHVPENRIDDVVYLTPGDTEYPVALNIFDGLTEETRIASISALLGVFKRHWSDVWSPDIEELLLHALIALSYVKGATIFSAGRLVSERAFRTQVLAHIRDERTRTFWKEEYEDRQDQFNSGVSSLVAKLGVLSGNPIVRSILGQSGSNISFEDIVNKRRILIVNLSKGQIGEDVSDFIGSIIVAKLYTAALARAAFGPAALSSVARFYLYVDECHSIGRGIFADMLSEARKYKLCLTMAHQYLDQLDEKTRSAVFGNVGSIVTFRLGSADAQTLETTFHGKVGKDNFLRLGFAQIYLALMIHGATSAPFSEVTLPPIKPPDRSHYAEIISRSRARYARPKAAAELSAEIGISAAPVGAISKGDVEEKSSQVKNALGALGIGGAGARPGAPGTMQAPRAPGSPPVPQTPREIPEAVLREILHVDEPAPV